MGRPWITDKRICLNCGSDTTYIRKHGFTSWRRYKDGWLCKKCHFKIIEYPLRAHKTLRFKHKLLSLKENPRKGICSLCGKKGLTNMHHKEYHEDDPLKDTIELCGGCHLKTHGISRWMHRNQ